MPLFPLFQFAQIWTNFRNGGTGQLSGISIFMMLFRSTGRLFTYLMETGDPYRIAVYAISTALNLVLVAQILHYGKATEKADKPKSN